MRGNRLAIVAALIATAVGASSGLYIKTLPLSSFALTGFRMGVPFLFFLPLIVKRKLILGPKIGRKKVLLGAFLNALRMYLYVLAFKLTTITNAVVLLYLWPIFALLLDNFISKKLIKPRELLILTMALSGVVLLNFGSGFSLSEGDIKGSLVMILSALIFSISMLVFKEVLKKHSEPEVLYFQNAVGAIIFLPMLLMEIPSITLNQTLLGLLYGFSAGIIGFGLFFYALKRLPIFQYGALTYTEVFWGGLYGVLLLNESLSINTLLGIGLILTGSILSRFSSE